MEKAKKESIESAFAAFDSNELVLQWLCNYVWQGGNNDLNDYGTRSVSTKSVGYESGSTIGLSIEFADLRTPDPESSEAESEKDMPTSLEEPEGIDGPSSSQKFGFKEIVVKIVGKFPEPKLAKRLLKIYRASKDLVFEIVSKAGKYEVRVHIGAQVIIGKGDTERLAFDELISQLEVLLTKQVSQISDSDKENVNI